MEQEQQNVQPNPQPEQEFWGMSEKSFTTMMHVSQFGGLVLLFAGYALPLVMWLSYKDKSVLIDQHGKNIVNWIISEIIYLIVFGILSLIFIGLPFLFAVGILSIVFPIVGAINADKNIIWTYPLSFKFIN